MTRISRVWTAVILFTLVVIVLLIFILQNQNDVRLSFLWVDGMVPLAVAMLFSAVAGALLVAIPGVGRVIQLRTMAKRAMAPATPVRSGQPEQPGPGRPAQPGQPTAAAPDGNRPKGLFHPSR